MLSIEHVTKKYEKFTALRDINLILDCGVYGLLAPNGAGKTTLLKMLATLLFPTEGRILYDGEEIQKLDEKYREKIGFLPQDFGYYRNQSPVQYLRYIGILKGIPKKELKSQIQALLGDPQILILDEPTAGLDPKERGRFRKILSSLSENKIVLISTHIVSDVESVANHIIFLKDKSVFCNASVDELCQSLEGRVFETRIREEKLSRWEEMYPILSQRQERRQVSVRFIADRREDGWEMCEPGLEDVFLYTYGE